MSRRPRQPSAPPPARSLRERFLEFDDTLAAHGVPPLTSWWRREIGEWLDEYEAGGPLEFWAAVGRGASKSTALYRLAMFFALFVDWRVPPGEVHYAIILSRQKEEAGKAITTIGAWLKVLGVPHRASSDVIDLVGRPVGFRIAAASVAAASGWRAFFVGCDEYAKWPMAGLDELVAGEVRTSAVAMTTTHARAPVVTVGSAWGAMGEFFDAISGGTTVDRYVAGPVPSWVAAAEYVTEASTRAKERVESRWRREFRCDFAASISALWTAEQVDRMMSPREAKRALVRVSREVLVTDPSNLKKDAWTACIAGWWQYQLDPRDLYLWEDYPDRRAANGIGQRRLSDASGNPLMNPNYGEGCEPFFLIREILTYDRTFGRSGASLVAELAQFARARGITQVISDQRDAMLLHSEFARWGMHFEPVVYTNSNKADAVLWLSERVRTDSLRIERHDRMRAELLEFREKIMPSGTVVYAGLKHDDHVSLLLTSAIADALGLFGGSPTRVPGGGPPTELGPGDFRRGVA